MSVTVIHKLLITHANEVEIRRLSLSLVTFRLISHAHFRAVIIRVKSNTSLTTYFAVYKSFRVNPDLSAVYLSASDVSSLNAILNLNTT